MLYDISSQKNNNTEIVLELNGVQIQRLTSCRYLGVIIDNDLTWTAHMDCIYSRLLKHVGIFYKLINKLPKSVLKNIYFAFVYSCILYGVELFVTTSQTHLDRLIVLIRA